MLPEGDTTKAEWQMYECYGEIVDIANANSRFKLNENSHTIVKLAQKERGLRLSFYIEVPEMIVELRKEIMSVIKKLTGLREYRKWEAQLMECSLPLDNCTSSADFYKVILKVKEITDKHKKPPPLRRVG